MSGMEVCGLTFGGPYQTPVPSPRYIHVMFLRDVTGRSVSGLRTATPVYPGEVQEQSDNVDGSVPKKWL